MSIELKQAAQQALNALDEATTYTGSPSWSPSMTDECIAAASALRAALSQPTLSNGLTEAETSATASVMGLTHDSEYVSRFGRVTLSGPREDVEFAVRHLPDVDDGAQQPATGEPVVVQHRKPVIGWKGETIGYTAWMDGKGLDGWPHRELYDHPAPGVPDDRKRLDYLQDRGATIDLIAGVADFYPMRFRVGGLHSSANIDVRAAIDAAMLAAK